MKAVRSPLAAALVAVGVVLAGCGLLDLPSPAPDPPQFDPPGGTYTEHLSVSIESPDGSVYASTDPDADVLDFEPINGDSIYVADDMVLRAYVIDDRGVRSPVAEADYLIDDVAAPVISSNELRQTNVEYFGWDIEWDASPGDDTTDPDPSDDLTDWYALEFAVYASGADDISTIEDADLNGVLVQDWHSSNSSGNIGSAHWDASSPGERRYINVFVRDEEGNVSAYGTVRMASRVALDVYAAGTGAGADDEIWLNPADGSYAPAFFQAVLPPVTPGLESTHAVALVDLDGDGYDDLIASYTNGGTTYQSWFHALGNGRFDTTPTHFEIGSEIANHIEVADVDGDGSLDAVFANAGTSGVSAYRASGDLIFTVPVTSVDCISLGDINSDGYSDFAVGVVGTGVSIWMNQAGVSATAAAQSWTGETVTGPTDVLLTDVDSDGDADLVVASSSGKVEIYYSDGASALVPETAETWGFEATVCLAAVDWDGDSDVDLIFGNDTYTSLVNTRVYLSDGSGGYPTWVDADSGATSAPNDLTVADINGDGIEDFVEMIDAGGFKLWLNDGLGGVSDGPLFASADGALAIGRLR